MNVNINKSWQPLLQTEFDKPYFSDLAEFVRKEYKSYQCFPKGAEIFNAFNHSTFDDTRVVILGQDPYHGPGQANGLCFSVNKEIPHPPSLINILKELEQDLGIPYPKSGNLIPWADQGVLLLNATLTVRASIAGSHQGKGWERFTDAVIATLSKEKERLIFLLWGGYAKRKAKLIDRTKHQILESGHPSPLSANRGYWFGNKHFSTTNFLLQQAGEKAIDWKLL